jgi:hypothetical protein
MQQNSFNLTLTNLEILIIQQLRRLLPRPEVFSFLPEKKTPSNSSAVKTPENTEEDPHDLEPANKGDVQMEYSSDLLYSSHK